MTVHTRLATAADADAVAALFDAYRQFYEQAPDAARAAAFLGARQQRGESLLLVAQAAPAGDGSSGAGPLLGFCQLYPTFCSVEAQPIFALYDLFTTPAARGRGVGRALLLAAEALARAQGKVRMDLTTARDNLAAQRLYESLGWQRDTVFLAYSRRIDGVVPAADEDDAFFVALERRRTRALVERDLPTLDALHAPDYELVTPAGRVFDRQRYLGAIAAEPFYAGWEVGEVRLRRSAGQVLLRYPARLSFPSGKVVQCWHLDAWEQRGAGWQAAWSQATEQRPPATA